MQYINKIMILIGISFLLFGCGEITYSDNNITQKDKNNIDSISSEIKDTVVEIQQDSTVGKTVYKKCAGCHGVNGEKAAFGKSGIIGGDDKEALIYQLQEYQAGRLNQYGMGPLMKGQVVELSEKELKLVASYVSRLSGI